MQLAQQRHPDQCAIGTRHAGIIDYGRYIAYFDSTDAHGGNCRVPGRYDAIGRTEVQPIAQRQLQGACGGMAHRQICGPGIDEGLLSNNCTKHDARTANACADVAQLHTDRARVIETTRLEERAAELRRTIHSLRSHGGASAPDPVGEFWAWLTRGFFSVKDVGFGLPLAFAVMIEMVSAFGPLGIVAYAEATRATTGRDVSRHVAKDHDMSGPSATISDSVAKRDGVAAVVSYIAERTEPTESAAGIGVEELFADYLAWCMQGRIATLRFKDFTRIFDELRSSPELEGKIKKFGRRYFGIALAPTRGAAGGQS
jgi:hypothetical protein